MKTKIAWALFAITICTFAGLQHASAQAARVVSAEDAAKGALKAGSSAPYFALKDINGKVVSSKDLRNRGNIVLVFYRGSWCPFCNTYLHKLQTRLADITAAGGQLVAISVENPDASMAVAKKNELQFTVLSDPELKTARRFGIVYQMQSDTDELYKKNGLDVAKHNAMEKPELPLAATYIIDRKGQITYAFIETDYKKRAEPDAIIEHLKMLRKRPLGMSDVLEFFTNTPVPTVSDVDLSRNAIESIRRSCVDFVDDGTNYWALKLVGASDELIGEIDKCLPPAQKATIKNAQRKKKASKIHFAQKTLISDLFRRLYSKKDIASRKRTIAAAREYIKRYDGNRETDELLEWLKDRLPKFELSLIEWEQRGYK